MSAPIPTAESRQSLRRIDRAIVQIQAATLGGVTGALYCRRGHHLAKDNFYRYGNHVVCRQCRRDALKRHRDHLKLQNPAGTERRKQATLDASPLIAFVDFARETRSHYAFLVAKGLSTQTFYRMKRTGKVTPRMADLWCTRLDTHTSNLWPERWAA